MLSLPLSHRFWPRLAGATGLLLTLWIIPGPVAQVRPLVLEESSRVRRMAEPQLFPPRRAELEELWEVEAGGTLLAGLMGGSGAFVYALRDGQVVSRATEDGRLLWTREIPGLAWPPLGLNRRLFVIEGQALTSLDPGDGSTLWSQPLPAPAAFAPVVTDQQILVALQQGDIATFSPAGGEPIWQTATGCLPEVEPQLQGGLVIVGCPDGMVRAFSATDGAALWERQLKKPILVRPAVAKDRVFLGTADHTITCLGTAHGKKRYRAKMAGNASAPLQIYKDLVLAGSTDNLVYAIKQHRGFLAWSADAGARLLTPVVTRSHLAASSPLLATQLMVMDLRDGAVLARERLSGEDRISAGSPHFAGLTLVAMTQPVSGGAGWLTGYKVTVSELDPGPMVIPPPSSTP
jgi:outer membrane protein assembly factor BamB